MVTPFRGEPENAGHDEDVCHARNGYGRIIGKEGETLVLNANHPLVQYVTCSIRMDSNVAMICEQLYDLALLTAWHPFEPEAMSEVCSREATISCCCLTK